VSADKRKGDAGGGGLSSRRLVIAVAIVVLVAAGAFLAARPARNPTALIGGPFSLQTAGGKTLTDADFKGHPFLVYFGYTHCPDVCPTTLADIADALRKIPDAPIRALFITVDPERD